MFKKVMEGFSKPPIPVVAEVQPIKIISDKSFPYLSPIRFPKLLKQRLFNLVLRVLGSLKDMTVMQMMEPKAPEISMDLHNNPISQY